MSAQAIGDAKGERGPIVALQLLRFFAALLVLLSHIGDRMVGFEQRYGVAAPFVKFSGHFGVAVFFVISGFIMIHVSGDKGGSWKAAGSFAKKRILRVAPLYWVLTLVQAALLFGLGSVTAEPGRLTVANLVKSVLFIPYMNYEGKHRPVLEQGWTLDFEMMFYAIFAITLAFAPRWGLAILICSLLAIGLFPGHGLPFAIDTLLDPIVLYFLAGICIGLARKAWTKIRPLPAPSSLAQVLPLVAIVAFTITDNMGGTIWAAPILATACVLAAVGFQSNIAGRWSAAQVFLGDMSYSLYLAHGFGLLFVGIAWRKLFGGEHLMGYVAVAMTVSLAGSAACYLLIEKPLTRWLSRVSNAKRSPASQIAPVA